MTMKKHEPKREVQNEFSKSEPEEESETKEDRKVVEAASSTKKVLEVGYEPNNEDVICSWARQNVRTPNEYIETYHTKFSFPVCCMRVLN